MGQHKLVCSKLVYWCWIFLYRIQVIPCYLVYVCLKIGHFAELIRWGKNQKGRLRLDKRLTCFVTYLLWDPLWELICCNKWHPGTLGIFTPPEIAVETYFCALELPQYFYLLIENPFSCYFQVWGSYYQVAQCSQTTAISTSLRW